MAARTRDWVSKPIVKDPKVDRIQYLGSTWSRKCVKGCSWVPSHDSRRLPTTPATQLTTVNEILRQSDGMRKALNLDEIVIVMDQALYAKASEVIWQHPDQYSAILLRLGTFHTMCNLLSIIGKRYQDAGLRDLCIESGIIAEGSVSGVLEGKMYNRAVRVHKCVYEAFNASCLAAVQPLGSK